MSDDYMIMLAARLQVHAEPEDKVRFIDKSSRLSEEEEEDVSRTPNSDK